MADPRWLGIPLALATALGIAGCGSLAGPNGSGWAGGVPPEAPARPTAQAPYPDVYDVPPPRTAKLISASERARIEAELAASGRKVNAQGDALQRERIGTER